jgi:hypothetical protein
VKIGGAGAALACAVLALALLPTSASARGIEVGFADPMYHSRESAERGKAFRQSVAAGASYARLIVSWRAIARAEPENPKDPFDPAYRFDRLDASIRAATDQGLQVLLTIHSAPEWAERKVPSERSYPAPPGTENPDPRSLRRFAEALARRYSGDAAGPLLPRVTLYEAWNEPNLTGFLSPQWIDGRPRGPRLYRNLLNAVYRGVHAAQPDAKVIAGATAPFGGGQRESRRVRPLRFLRELFCLRGRHSLRPVDGPKPARFDLLSHHPISPEWGPRSGARHPDDATIPQMRAVRRTLRAAERQGTVMPRGRKRELWATEFWWETDPPITLYEAPSERRQARNIADALHLLYRQRVPVALLFQVFDDAEVSGPPREGWGSGVLFSDGARKLAFTAARFPFVATRARPSRVGVWTRAPVAGRLEIVEVRKRRGPRVLTATAVAAGEIFRARVKARGPMRLRARIAGVEQSPAWRVPGRRGAR